MVFELLGRKPHGSSPCRRQWRASKNSIIQFKTRQCPSGGPGGVHLIIFERPRVQYGRRLDLSQRHVSRTLSPKLSQAGKWHVFVAPQAFSNPNFTPGVDEWQRPKLITRRIIHLPNRHFIGMRFGSPYRSSTLDQRTITQSPLASFLLPPVRWSSTLQETLMGAGEPGCQL